MVVSGVVVAIVGSEHSDADVVFQSEIAGDAVGVAVAHSGGNEEFSLIAVLVPLQVVFSTARVEADEVSGEYVASAPFARPVTDFQSAHEYLQAVSVIVYQPPGEHVFSVERPAFAYGDFQFDVGHERRIKEEIGFYREEGVTAGFTGCYCVGAAFCWGIACYLRATGDCCVVC